MADESTAPEGVENEEALPEGEVTEATETEEVEETEVEEEPESDEYDFGGNKLKLPKGSVPDELRDQIEKFSKGTWADYTRKSQEVAEARKAVEAERSVVTKLAGLSDELLDTFSRGKQLKTEIEQLSKYDINALWQSNPDQARRLSDTISQKQAEFQSVVAQVAQKEQALTQTQAAEVARQKEQGKAVLSRQIKDFDKALPEVIAYATEKLGIAKEAAQNDWALNPAMTMAVYKAAMFDKLQAKAAKAAKPQPTAPTPMAPIKGKGGSRPLDLVKDADKLTADEWMRRRTAEIAKRANA